MHRVSCLVCLMQKLGKAYHTDARPATEGGAGGRVVKNLLNARVTEENGQGKRGETRLQVELVNIRTPFFERFVADGVLHEAGFLLGLLLGDAERLREEREQHVMAVEDRHAVGVPFFGERDVAVIGLVGKTLFLERADRSLC